MNTGQYVRARRRQTDPYTYFGLIGRRVLRRPFKRAQQAADYSAAVQARLARLRAAADSMDDLTLRLRQTAEVSAPARAGGESE